MTAFELRPATSAAQTEAEQLVWPASAHGEGALDSELTPMLAELGAVSDAAIDLARFATAAYLADERSLRPPSFTRSIAVTVHVTDPDRWSGGALDVLADLLEATTGDQWELAAVASDPIDRADAPEHERPAAARVALLSGGLDSFAGAALTSEAGDTVYMGHWDIPTVKGAQNRVSRHFRDAGRPLDYTLIDHGLRKAENPRDGKVEHTQRTRAILFKSLAIALASARGAETVEVPENGFTSLNPPLGPERGGPLTTRSTHPMTIFQFNQLLGSIGITTRVENPHQWLTKGELVRLAATHLPDFAAGMAQTYSCAKMDGGRYKGGDWNKHCGLCYACLVRRGAIAASGLADATDYLSETLEASQRRRLIDRRGSDLAAVAMALETELEELDILALGPFPPTFDLDADLGRALDLCRRGFDEIRRVPLP
jgi:Queuosine biosynthesis protein QueC